jgi:CRP-like cAMP-binding protein
MTDEHVAVLAARSRTIKVPARTRLFEEGGTADRFWLIQSGQVVLDTFVPGNGKVIIDSLGRRDVVGLSWLFPPFRWGFGAITTQPVQAIEIDAKAIREVCGQDPAFGYEVSSRFIGVALHRLQTTRRRLLDQPAQRET